MKKFDKIIALLLIVLAIYWSFSALMPSYKNDASAAETSFSTDRALKHIEKLSAKPHGVGFPAHKEVRDYIVSELEKLGLEVSLQEGYTAGDWGNLSKAVNILARVQGSEQGKALLLLTHYDSSPHSSLGASDAGSGVATILEGVRAFLAGGNKPKNDIIILISDAEELGLNGADLFVNRHPWSKEVGLVLNFEARGSGGPGYMLIETNQGNSKLISEFVSANPKYPVANSLAYSIYKMLPNDTDLTVFREDGDIEGFNFAFIDDHFDYHTVRDNYERLDRSTLAHQGSYLMPLLHHFSNAGLEDLKSKKDDIYFNVPFFGLITYPFDWIWPMFGFAVLAFLVLLIQGFRSKTLRMGETGKGFIPLLIALAINGLLGFYGWNLLTWIYPEYRDILHGFTYNGHLYIAAFVFISLAICFWSYHLFRRISTPNVLVAPLVLWLVICGALAQYLPGASFFIVPLLGLIAAFMVSLRQEKPKVYLLVFLSIPALWILSPLVKMFPVGLGLKMIITTTLLSTLIFFLLLPVFGLFKRKQRFSSLFFVLFFGFMLAAHLNADFDADRAKPTSLLYVLNTEDNEAVWATYERVLSDWTSQYLGAEKRAPEQLADQTISSKYSTGFSFVADAPVKDIPAPLVEKLRDTIIDGDRFLHIQITPQRSVNRLEVFTNDINLHTAKVNRVSLSSHFLQNRRFGKLITHFISDNSPTTLALSFPGDTPLELSLFEASNDLLEHSLFSVPERPEDNIPMPFVLNDAVLVTKKVKF